MKALEVTRRLDQLEQELVRLEASLVAVQREYEERAQELNRLQDLQRRLSAYRLPDPLSLSWTAVCRDRRWPVAWRGAHSTVKRRDPGLHALLHLCAFDSFCALDSVMYAP
jgi:hypothetical protein